MQLFKKTEWEQLLIPSPHDLGGYMRILLLALALSLTACSTLDTMNEAHKTARKELREAQKVRKHDLGEKHKLESKKLSDRAKLERDLLATKHALELAKVGTEKYKELQELIKHLEELLK